jgi:CPA2 family monovalent cation:H+ antiporter-2
LPDRGARRREEEPMHNIDLILTLAAGLMAALVLGYATHRLGWSPIVGYLLAGILVGPNTPGFVANRALAEQLAEVGVILLMFGVGMHFHVKDLLAVRGIAIAGAVVQSATATALGALAFHALGLSWTPGIVLGLALSVASTVVLIRVLSDNGQLQSPTGRIAVGWLVMEDIFTVFILVLLPVVVTGSGGGTSSSLPVAFLWAAVKVGLLVALTLYAGGRFVPWLLNKVAETRSRELFTLCVLSVALGIAVGSSVVFGVSMALGAFLAGMVVGQSEFSARAGAEALPMRDAFAVMFFLSVGLLFDPRQAIDAPMLTLATLAIVMIAKPLSAIVIVAVLGYSSQIGLGVALALAQVGEFSFLLATLGKQLGALDDAAMNALVAAAILSIMVNPVLYRLTGPLESRLKRHPRLWRLLNRKAGRMSTRSELADEPLAPAHRAVVVGYGPIGRMVTRILRGGGIEPAIVELNVETYRALQAEGIAAVYGDATQREVLEQAGIAGAASMILSASGASANTEAIRIAREINPDIHVVARGDFLRDTVELRKAGADEVFTGEGEVAVAIAGSILRKLGATPEQMDESRERIRLALIERPT